MFNRKKKQKAEIKQLSVNKISTKSENLNTQYIGYSYSQKDNWTWLSAMMCWNFYTTCSPVYNAIDITAQEFSNIEPEIYNTKTKTFSDEGNYSEVLRLLENPSTGVIGSTFSTEIVSSYLATGDLFTYITALNETSEPLEIFYINPIDIEILPGNDGYPISYEYSRLDKQITFYRTGASDYKYFTKDGTKQLLHVKRFNPQKSSRTSNNGFYGMSPLHPVYLEIDEYIESYVANKNLLKNGSRLSGMFLIDKNLDEKQYNHLQYQIKSEIQGAQNNGEVLILDGLDENGMQFVELSKVTKDMDWDKLIEKCRQQIYRILKIPAPLVELDSQKYSNYNMALAMLYKQAIIPLAKTLYTEFDLFLKHRYKAKPNEKLWFDTKKIESISAVKLEEALLKIKSNVTTKNEARDLLNLGPLDAKRGNELADNQTSEGMPTLKDIKSNDNLNSENRIRTIMSNQFKSDGSPVYEEDDIDKAVRDWKSNESI